MTIDAVDWNLIIRWKHQPRATLLPIFLLTSAVLACHQVMRCLNLLRVVTMFNEMVFPGGHSEDYISSLYYWWYTAVATAFI